ncbi:MAG: hypothetical protein AVDCRST_MAG23-954, partial [uncultured Sphingosinicella sp.]
CASMSPTRAMEYGSGRATGSTPLSSPGIYAPA